MALAALSGAAQAQTPGTAEAGVAALQLYQYRLLQVGTRLRGYPPEALRRRLEGTATVALHVSEAGTLSYQTLVHSSGQSVLDDHALALLALAVPLTEIPSALQNRAFIVRVAVAFRLPEDD